MEQRLANWISLTDVAEEFDLKHSATDPSLLARDLKAIMTSIHPDKTNGEFESEGHKARFHRAKEAVDFVEARATVGTEMIPISQLPALVQAMSQALVLSRSSSSKELRTDFVTDARAQISQRLFVPRLSSGAFAGASAFLFAFPEKIEKNPIFLPLMKSDVWQGFVLILLAYSILFFILTWYWEKRAEAHVERLMSESATAGLFTSIVDFARPNDGFEKISASQIRGILARDLGYRTGRSRLWWSGLSGLPAGRGTIEKAAAVQIQRLVERKALTKLDLASIDTWYRIDPTARQEASQERNPTDSEFGF